MGEPTPASVGAQATVVVDVGTLEVSRAEVSVRPHFLPCVCSEFCPLRLIDLCHG